MILRRGFESIKKVSASQSAGGNAQFFGISDSILFKKVPIFYLTLENSWQDLLFGLEFKKKAVRERNAPS